MQLAKDRHRVGSVEGRGRRAGPPGKQNSKKKNKYMLNKKTKENKNKIQKKEHVRWTCFLVLSSGEAHR